MTNKQEHCCHKCGSQSVYLEYDLGSWYEHCLICGFLSPLEEIKIYEEEPMCPRDIS